MSHTNSTANYNLPQFVGNDTPAWLTDVNGAMTSIDTQMKVNADSASTANASATTANSNIGTLSNLNTTSKTNLVSAVNEVNTNLNTVSGVASDASSNATSAKNKADGIETYLTLTQFNTLTGTSNNATIAWSSLREAVNADGSTGKIYGAFLATPTSTSNSYVRFASSFRPSSKITINAGAIKQRNNYPDTDKTIYPADFTIDTDGTIQFDFANNEYNIPFRFVLPPCVYFAKDFGDTGSL